MTPLRLRAIIRYLLCVIFLAVQGAPVHAHLSATHDHDGPRHAHPSTAHAHQLAVHHADVFELDHGAEAAEAVVDLAPEGGPPAGLQADLPAAAPARLFTAPLATDRSFQGVTRAAPRQRPRLHVGEPRAPPSGS